MSGYTEERIAELNRITAETIAPVIERRKILPRIGDELDPNIEYVDLFDGDLFPLVN